MKCDCGLCGWCVFNKAKERANEELTPGSCWRHRNGNMYTIVTVANMNSKRLSYPPTVVYMGVNGNIWSRPVKDWFSSMEKV